jgi:peptidyl-tRNA hydrolase, PTH1 family
MKSKRLIIGLGNPGPEYEKTRHNVGFRIVQALARKDQVSLVKEKSFPAFYGRKNTDNFEMHYLMPLTYMNDSGMAMKRCMEYFKIGFQSILVITDDTALPFGTIRIRPMGSCGGHNGLRSVEEWLGSDRYSRLRIGVGEAKDIPQKSYVLANLSEAEELKWPQVEAGANDMIQQWILNTQLSKSWVLNDLN